MFAWVYLSDAIYKEFSAYFVRHSALVSPNLRSELPNITRIELGEIESKQLEKVRFQKYFIDVFDISGKRIVEPGIVAAELDKSSIDSLTGLRPSELHDTNWITTPSSFNADHVIVALQRVIARNGTEFIILQATDDEYAQDRVIRMGQTLLVMSLAAPFLSLVAGWFISRIAVAPLSRIQDLVSTLNPDSLDEQLEIPEQSTEVMELVAQIDHSRDQIKRAFQSQARFLSNVSHELKTPIAVMQIESETVELEGSSDEVKEFVRSVRDEMARLGKMVESFLTLTRLEDGFGNMSAKRYAFNDLVMDSMDQCASMSYQNAIELIPILFSDEETIGLSIQGDSDLLITMLNNLIRNAIRYSPTGGAVTIELQNTAGTPIERLGIESDSKPPEQAMQTVQLRVSDQGPGIPSDKIDHIFDRFAKIESADRSGRGHGLGLAIAQGIAELHGGTIQVANNSSEGCTFTVRLPAIAELGISPNPAPPS